MDPLDPVPAPDGNAVTAEPLGCRRGERLDQLNAADVRAESREQRGLSRGVDPGLHQHFLGSFYCSTGDEKITDTMIDQILRSTTVALE